MPSIEQRVTNLLEEYDITSPEESNLRTLIAAAVDVQRHYLSAALYEPTQDELTLVFDDFILLCATRGVPMLRLSTETAISLMSRTFRVGEPAILRWFRRTMTFRNLPKSFSVRHH